MSPVANYAEAKKAAAMVVLANRMLSFLDNPEPVKKAAQGLGDRNTMFNLAFSQVFNCKTMRVNVELYHDYSHALPTCKDEAGNTLQACCLRARVSWPALENGSPKGAYLRARFLLDVAELADDVNVALIVCGDLWELIIPATQPG